MKEIGIGIIGFGTVGSGVVKALTQNHDVLNARVGLPLRLVKVADLDVETDRGVAIDRSLLTVDVREVLDNPDVDIVVELMGGYEPAKRFILEALARKKQVVTANKALLAEHGAEVFGAAHAAGVDIAFEAAVGGGIPILRSLREGLTANRFEKVLGILNGTCNYILTAMDENPGAHFETVLAEAQALGYAEADPSFDIDGIDTAHKLALVLSLTHGIRTTVGGLFVEGIRGIDPFDVLMAKEFGYKIKLLGIILSRGDEVEARVHPTMLPMDHLLSSVNGVFNGVFLEGDLVGEQLFYGRGAGKEPTASAVMGDIIETARNVARGEVGRVPPLGYPQDWVSPVRLTDMSEVRTNYYLRIQAQDRPGVLSKVAGIMADYGISIHSVMQKGRHTSATVPVVFLTHRAREADMRAACRHIEQLDDVEGAIRILRVEDGTLA
jgi:homoserine dehydrogenase